VTTNAVTLGAALSMVNVVGSDVALFWHDRPPPLKMPMIAMSNYIPIRIAMMPLAMLSSWSA
jgi:hypothetical protein